MKKTILSLILVLAVFISACSGGGGGGGTASNTSTKITITGTVTGASSTPLAGVTVNLLDPSGNVQAVITDSNGNFSAQSSKLTVITAITTFPSSKPDDRAAGVAITLKGVVMTSTGATTLNISLVSTAAVVVLQQKLGVSIGVASQPIGTKLDSVDVNATIAAILQAPTFNNVVAAVQTAVTAGNDPTTNQTVLTQATAVASAITVAPSTTVCPSGQTIQNGSCNTATNTSGITPGTSTVTTLATGQGSPSYIAVDATSVYWVNWSGSSLYKLSKNGGAVTMLASGENTNGIAVDATSVYLANVYNSATKVDKVSINGGAVTTLSSATGFPYCLAADATSVYWADGKSLYKVSINGGTVNKLATTASCASGGIAVDATSVYWADNVAGTVNKVPLGGGAVATLASGRSLPWGIAVDATGVYWTEYTGGTVNMAGLNGGTVTTLASGQSSPMGIEVDATSVYWVTAKTVNKVPLGGGAVTTLASGQGSVVGIAVDSTSVYWTDSVAGTVNKVNK